MSNFNRLSPFPYDAIIGGVGVMLRPDPQTKALLSSPKVAPYDQVAPLEYNYSSVPPFDERAYEFRRLIMGLGEKTQQFATVRRYFYADGVDCSINGMPMLGPEVTSVTPASSGRVVGFVEALDQGTVTLFALAGRYVLVRKGDLAANWTVSKDLGVGVVAQSGVRFKDAGATPKDCLYVSTSDHKLWQYDGTSDTTTWSDLTVNLSATAADQACDYLETNGNELFRAWGNKIANCSSDPNVAANWSGDVFVGDSSMPITWLRELTGTLMIFKANGIYTVDSTGDDHELFPELRTAPSVSNGQYAAAWANMLWFHYGDGFYSLGPNSGGTTEMHPVGPERFIENDSPVRGFMSCSAGWSNWFNFLGLVSPDGNSYLLKYGSWFVDDQPPLGSSAFIRRTAIYDPISASGSFFEPVIHGAIASFPGKTLTSLLVSSITGTANQRLYLGFTDGTVSWIVLPRGSPNPISDSNCRYQTAGKLIYGHHTMNFPAQTKAFRGATVFGSQLDLTHTVEWDYRLDNGTFLALDTFNTSGTRSDLPAGTSGTGIDVQLQLAGDGAGTPLVEGFALHESLRPDLLLERDGVVKALDRIPRRDGSADWRTAEQIRAAMLAAANAKGTVAAVLPDGTATQLQIQDYAETLAADEARFGLAWDISFKSIEFVIPSGSIARLKGTSIGSLKPYTIGQLVGI